MRGSRNFCQGGPGQSDKKKALTVCFFVVVFLVLSLFYRREKVNFKENYLFQGSRGGPTFSRMLGGGGGVGGGGGGGGWGTGRTFSRGGGPIAYSL